MPATLLLVDDDDAALEFFRIVLTKDGHKIHTASDGHEAVEILATTKIDAVVSDVSMPGMDGFELLRHIREQFPKLSVVLVTATGSMEAGLKALDDGALSYLAKPVTPADLREVVWRAVAPRA